jgi:hypothetical protein
MPTGARAHPQLGGAARGSSGLRAGPSVGRPTAANTATDDDSRPPLSLSSEAMRGVPSQVPTPRRKLRN